MISGLELCLFLYFRWRFGCKVFCFCLLFSLWGFIWRAIWYIMECNTASQSAVAANLEKTNILKMCICWTNNFRFVSRIASKMYSGYVFHTQVLQVFGRLSLSCFGMKTTKSITSRHMCSATLVTLVLYQLHSLSQCNQKHYPPAYHHATHL